MLICKSIYTIYWDKTQMFKKVSRDKISIRKNALFILSRASTHHSLTFNLWHMSWRTGFICLKLCVGCFIFGSASFLLKFIWFKKKHELFDFKIKIIGKPHTVLVLLPDLWFLSCNTKFEKSVVPGWVEAPLKLNFLNLQKLINVLRTSV